MNKIPTAEEILSKNQLRFETGKQPNHRNMVKEAMIEFAKLHVEAAQEAWFNKIKSEGLVTQDGIAYLKNAYSLENIK
jgi:hypothetical protein